MALAPGTRIGVYEILFALGAGGMGEIYRARDVTLGREVALKVLPQVIAHDAARIARFQREAKTLASMNHPNIAVVYGFEQAGAVHALVMELVDGEDLAQRIRRGAIPVAETIAIATQIADALESAHEQGIVHRDLKPANIMVKLDGTVKVLDFGLAKTADPAGGSHASEMTALPTPATTQPGIVMGTPAYMSPEQSRGKPVDRRTDVWAFGCVLYEMLTGRRAFPGEDSAETLAAVVKTEPEWNALPFDLPATLRVFLQGALRKDLKQRVGDVRDLRLALQGAFDTPASAARPLVATTSPWTRGALLAGAAVGGASLAVLLSQLVGAVPVAKRVSRVSLAFSPATELTINGSDRDLAITPDGSRVVYVGNNGTQLFVRALDALEPVAVFTGEPRGPFVSPDGRWIGFVDGNTALMKVATDGGAAVTVATLDSNGPRGGTWGGDDTIVIATNNPTTGLQRIAAQGGTTTVLTKPDRGKGEADHLWPELLPGGHAVLYTITATVGGPDASQIAVLDLKSGTSKVLIPGGSHAQYVGSGHLVYAAGGSLRAVPFDLATLETRGTPVPVVSEVASTAPGALDAVVAGDGTLAYVSGGGAAAAQRTLVWVDRQGRETAIGAPPRAYVYPRLSPDGSRIALYAQDQALDLWMWDLVRSTLTRATFDPALDAHPAWTPDGRRVVFSSERAGARNLYWQTADGTQPAERLAELPNPPNASAVSPDGSALIFSEADPVTGDDLMQLALDGSRRVTPLVKSSYSERNGVVSGDGRWLAYESNDSGRFEVFVRPFGDPGSGFWQVSTIGGTRPLWSRDGQELFYFSPTGSLMSVRVSRRPSWEASTPSEVVKAGYMTSPGGSPGRTYDISPDGQRFLLIKQGAAPGENAPHAKLILALNWTEDLRRLVPSSR